MTTLSNEELIREIKKRLDRGEMIYNFTYYCVDGIMQLSVIDKDKKEGLNFNTVWNVNDIKIKADKMNEEYQREQLEKIDHYFLQFKKHL